MFANQKKQTAWHTVINTGLASYPALISLSVPSDSEINCATDEWDVWNDATLCIISVLFSISNYILSFKSH